MNLARPGDPMLSGGGKAIEPENTVIETYAERRKVLPKLVMLSPTKSLTADDLPEPDPQRQTVIAAIVGYKLMGLNDIDIADQLSTDPARISEIISSEAAQITFEQIFKSIVNTNADVLQARIAAHANGALDTIVDLMDNVDTRDDVRLKAAQDILDRSGTHADQFFGAENSDKRADDELRIVIMDDTGEKEKISVEIGRKT